MPSSFRSVSQGDADDILCYPSDDEDNDSSIPFLVPFAKDNLSRHLCSSSAISSAVPISSDVKRTKLENSKEEEERRKPSEMVDFERESKSILLLQLENLFQLDLGTFSSSPPIAHYLLSQYLHIPSGTFRPRQAEVCLHILRKRNTLAVCPTGWGKSLCYLFPMLVHRLMYEEQVRLWKLSQKDLPINDVLPSFIFSKFCVVVSPLISLMADQASRILEMDSLHCVVLSSQTSIERKTRILEELESPHSSTDIIFISPEKLIAESTLRKLMVSQPHRLAFICIDEVHCVSKWAFNFRPSYLCLHQLLQWTAPSEFSSYSPSVAAIHDSSEKKSVQYLCLTATASTDVIQDLQVLFHIQHTVECSDLLRTNLVLETVPVVSVTSSHDEHDDVVPNGRRKYGDPPTTKELFDSIIRSVYELPKPLLVYVRSRNDATEIAHMVASKTDASTNAPYSTMKEGEFLVSSSSTSSEEKNKGVSSPRAIFTRKTCPNFVDSKSQRLIIRAYHAGMSREQRRKLQQEFIAGRVDVLVATVAFGMGIDKSNIRSVLHAHAPSSLENYVQEIGRAGRDGKDAVCRILYNPYDYYVLRCTLLASYATSREVQSIVRAICSSPCAQYGEKILLIPVESLALKEEVHEEIVETILYMLVLTFPSIFKGIKGVSPIGYKILRQKHIVSSSSTSVHKNEKKVSSFGKPSFSGIAEILQQVEAEDKVLHLCEKMKVVEHLVITANSLRLSLEDLQFRLNDLAKSGAVLLSRLATAFIVAVEDEFIERVENSAHVEEMAQTIFLEHEKKLFQQVEGLSIMFEVLKKPSHTLIDGVMRGKEDLLSKNSRWDPPPPPLSRIQAVSIVNEFIDTNRIRLHSKYEAVRALLGVMPKSSIKTGKYAGQIPLSQMWYTQSPYFGKLREFDFSWVLKAVSAANLPE